MSNNKNVAAWVTGKAAIEIKEAPTPVPDPDELIVEVHSVAFNPADGIMWKENILFKKLPSVGGCDVAGIVTAVGSEVKRFKVGDRIIAYSDHTHSRENPGIYQLYSAVTQYLAAKLPDNISFTEGCVLPLALGTAAVAIFTKGTGGLELPYPTLNPKPTGKAMLVWGGSSSVGSCAIQMAKASGIEVATTCSAKNFEYCKEVGADHVFDHSSETVVHDVVNALNGKEFAGAFDAVFPPDTIMKSAEIAHQLGGKKHVATVLIGPPTPMIVPDDLPEDVQTSYTNTHPKDDLALSNAIFTEWLPPALAKGQIKCMPRPRVVGKGLESIAEACEIMSKGVSATKLVVDVL